MTQPRDVLHASELFQAMLAAIKARATLQTHNQSQAMFRAVMLAIRRHMSTEQVLTFADALPALPRGIFIEGWRPAEPAPLLSAHDLTRSVTDDLASHHVPPDTIVADVLAVLAEGAEPAIAKTMRDQLPAVLKPLWPVARATRRAEP
jgi:uncharacterized protein (DUF2267 family)